MLFYRFNGCITAGEKILKFKKVPGRVSANRQFGKNNQISASFFCSGNPLNDLFPVVFKIANMIILLNESDLHETNLLLSPRILTCRPERFYPDEKKSDLSLLNHY